MENAFGILAARWGIYNTTINFEPINVENAVKATCVLHNFLCIETNAAANNCPAGYADFCDTFGNVCEGGWRREPSVGAAMLATNARIRVDVS